MLNFSKVIRNLCMALACFGYVVSCTKVPTYFESSKSEIVDQITFNKVEKVVNYIDSQDEPFNLVIDSFGGSVLLGHRISTALEKASARGAKSTCTVLNQAYSMGFMILQYCDKRVASYGSTLMQHMPHSGQGFEKMTFETQEQMNSYFFALSLKLRPVLLRLRLSILEYVERYKFSKWYQEPELMCGDLIIDAYIDVKGKEIACQK